MKGILLIIRIIASTNQLKNRKLQNSDGKISIDNDL